MDLTTFDCLLPILSKQALINGSICLFVAIMFLGLVVFGVHIVREFLKSPNKVEDRWLVLIGSSVILIGALGFLLFLWFGLPRVLNPMHYALDYYVDVVKTTKGFYKP